jgi:hypothetical protein
MVYGAKQRARGAAHLGGLRGQVQRLGGEGVDQVVADRHALVRLFRLPCLHGRLCHSLPLLPMRRLCRLPGPGWGRRRRVRAACTVKAQHGGVI